MNKKDLKKLALLGMAGGLLVSIQTAEANESGLNADYGTYLAGKGCGNGCGNRRPQPSYNNDTTYYPQGQVYQPQGYSHGCGGSNSTYQGRNPEPVQQAQQNDRYQIQSGVDYSNVPYYDPNNIIAEGPAATAQTKPKLNEADLLKHLSAQGKATYQTLSPEGKILALKLANEDFKNKDKNDAVKAAAQKMAEKRNNTLNNNKTKNNH